MLAILDFRYSVFVFRVVFYSASNLELGKFSEIIVMKGVTSRASSQNIRQSLCPFPKETIRKLTSLEESQDTIFLVHPIDGNLKSLELLVSYLAVTVYGIEGTREAPLDSVEVLARFYIQAMRKVQPEGPYKLAGYSFGGAIAFEIALQLEADGSTVDSLLFLDSCPKWKHILQTFIQFKGLTQDFHTCTLVHFVTSHMNLHAHEVEKTIMNLCSWDEKVTSVAQLLKNVYTTLDLDEIKDLARAFSSRFRAALQYEPVKKVKCQAKLIKCCVGILDKHLATEFDYGLNENCYNPVEIFSVQAAHHSFIVEPLELGIPGIINQMYANADKIAPF